MGRFLARRLVLTIPVLLGVATLVFFLIHLIPGDPAQAMLGEAAPQSDVEELRRQLGLDRPLAEQYAVFLGMMLPMIFGRKVYNSLKLIMGVKIFLVLGFLLLVALLSGRRGARRPARPRSAPPGPQVPRDRARR